MMRPLASPPHGRPSKPPGRFVWLLAMLLAQGARAQEDLPLPYSESSAAKPAAPAPTPGPPDVFPGNRDRLYGASDDTAEGLGLEALGGLILLDSARGGLGDPRAAVGARFTWDFGRLLTEPTLHNALFLDATWVFCQTSDGTATLGASTAYHVLTVAPAYEIPVGEGSSYGVYFQVGAGVALVSATQHSGTVETVSGYQPVFQYGLGFRGRPLLSEDGRLRLTFRVEITRLRRAYLNDTLGLLSAGLAF